MVLTADEKVRIVVSGLRILKEKPPRDAIPVESIQVDAEGDWKRILKMYQNVGGESKPARLLVKFWAEPIESQTLEC